MAVIKEAAMSAQIIHTAIAADAIALYQEQIADLRKHPATERTTALIAMREQLIEEMMSVIELGAERAEVECEQAAEAVEVSTALEAAIIDARATGCAMVLGAPSLVRELVRLVPGCTQRQGALEIATVETDGGELRLVRRAGSYQGALSWRAA
jgi:hypothetical protein